MTPEERIARLRARGEEAARDRGQRGLGSSSKKVPLDTSGLSTPAVWYELQANPRVTNMIDIIPFEVTRSEYENMRQFTGKPIGLKVGDLDYKLEVCVHQRIGVSQSSVLCLREMFGMKCSICDDMFGEYRKKNTPEYNERLAKSLQPQWRVIYKVYDYRDEEHNGFKLWDVAYKIFEEYLCEKAETSEDGYITFSNPYEGRVIEIEGRIKKIGKNEKSEFVECASLRFLPRSEPYTEDDILTFPLDSMLVIPTVDQVNELYYSSGVNDECVDPKPESNPPSRRSSPSRRSPGTERREEKKEVKNPCLGGGRLGHDLHKFQQCQEDCPEEVFNQCSSEYDAISAAAAKEQEVKNQQTTRRSSGSGVNKSDSRCDTSANTEPAQTRRRR